MTIKRRTTARGFQLIEFTDRYNAPCELQQSSLADFEQPGSSALWLGVRDNRMHLDVNQIQWLIRELQDWMEDGRFREA